MTLCLDCDGAKLTKQDILTLREALSFAEERLNQKPQSGVHLWHRQGYFVVYWRAGMIVKQKSFAVSSTTKASA